MLFDYELRKLTITLYNKPDLSTIFSEEITLEGTYHYLTQYLGASTSGKVIFGQKYSFYYYNFKSPLGKTASF